MTAPNRKPPANPMRAVTTKLPVAEYNKLVEQCDTEKTSVSALIRDALQKRNDDLSRKRDVEDIKLFVLVAVTESLLEAEEVNNPQHQKEFRDGVKKRIEDRYYEQQQ